MKKNDLIQLLKSLGVRPNKKLGQNFLFDQNLLEYIASLCCQGSPELTIEIGPGIGNLTDLITNSNTKLIIIEYDRKLGNYLIEKYLSSNVSVVRADACSLNFDAYSKNTPFTCVGNLPYNFSTIILSRLLQTQNQPERMCFLFQKEMAERLASGKDCKSYGAITIKTQALYNVKIVRKIPPSVFWPVPEVQSLFVVFTKKLNAVTPDLFMKLSNLVKISFSRRRGKLISNLKMTYQTKGLEQIFLNLNLDISSRPENLSVEQYLDLTALLDS